MSPDGGVTWYGINPKEIRDIAEGSRVVIDPNNFEHIIISSAHQGWTFESKDSGLTWNLVTNFESELQELSWSDTNQKFQGVQSIAFAPSDPTKVYAGFGVARCSYNAKVSMCKTPTYISLLTSSDGGSTWTIQEGTELEGLTVTEIVVHPQEPETAWAATAGGGVYKTVDGGTKWEMKSVGLGPRTIMGLAIDNSNPSMLYAGSDQQGLYKSVDGGETWHWSSSGMEPNEPIFGIVVDPVRPNVVYAGGWSSGVYVSENYGADWQQLNEGLRTRSVHDLAISADGETLFAATRGVGVFRLSTMEQAEFDSLSPNSLSLSSLNEISEIHDGSEIIIDGFDDDWLNSDEYLIGSSRTVSPNFMDFEHAYAFANENALYLLVDVVDPKADFTQIDIFIEADGRRYLLSWNPGKFSGYLTDQTDQESEYLGRTEHTEILMGDEFEAKVDLRDLGSPEKISLIDVSVWVGECCSESDWQASDIIIAGRDTSTEKTTSSSDVNAIMVDGYLDDWNNWNFVLMDVEGDSNSEWMDLTHAAVGVDDQALYFYAKVADSNAAITQYDFVIETDVGDFNVMWVPGSLSIRLADVTVSYQKIGHADNSLIMFGEAIEGQISFQDLNDATEIYSMRFKTIVDDEGTWTNADWMEVTIFKRIDE